MLTEIEKLSIRKEINLIIRNSPAFDRKISPDLIDVASLYLPLLPELVKIEMQKNGIYFNIKLGEQTAVFKENLWLRRIKEYKNDNSLEFQLSNATKAELRTKLKKMYDVFCKIT